MNEWEVFSLLNVSLKFYQTNALLVCYDTKATSYVFIVNR